MGGTNRGKHPATTTHKSFHGGSSADLRVESIFGGSSADPRVESIFGGNARSSSNVDHMHYPMSHHASFVNVDSRHMHYPLSHTHHFAPFVNVDSDVCSSQHRMYDRNNRCVHTKFLGGSSADPRVKSIFGGSSAGRKAESNYGDHARIVRSRLDETRFRNIDNGADPIPYGRGAIPRRHAITREGKRQVKPPPLPTQRSECRSNVKVANPTNRQRKNTLEDKKKKQSKKPVYGKRKGRRETKSRKKKKYARRNRKGKNRIVMIDRSIVRKLMKVKRRKEYSNGNLKKMIRKKTASRKKNTEHQIPPMHDKDNNEESKSQPQEEPNIEHRKYSRETMLEFYSRFLKHLQPPRGETGTV